MSGLGWEKVKVVFRSGDNVRYVAASGMTAILRIKN